MGSTNSIGKPGYHLKPKYDLHGMRRRRTDEKSGNVAAELPLTSMIDMFSVLVIFLLMNFSSTGEIFFVSRSVILPKALNSNPLMNAPLISIVGNTFYLDAPDGGVRNLQDTSNELPQIIAALKQLRAQMESKGAKEFQLNLQADENLPLGAVKRAMQASVAAGWPQINFATKKE